MNPPSEHPQLERRLHSSAPKRLLALDGAGGRNALTFPFLEAIESALQRQSGNPQLLLCEYFDLIGGTNTAAVIATALARGMSVRETQQLYEKLLGQFFQASPLWQRFTSSYVHEGVERALDQEFGNELLHSASLQTGLCIFAYRIDREWPVTFHNLEPARSDLPPLRLKDCLRASMAAPTYFPPVPIEVGKGDTGIFVDADLAMTGGAAMPLFLTATTSLEPLRWPVGEDRLFLVSVGAGRTPFRETGDQAQGRNLLGWASSLPTLLLLDAQRQNELFLRAIARSPLPAVVDEEMGEIDADFLPSQPALTYLRYDVDLAALGALGFDDLATQTARLSVADSTAAWADLLRIGTAAARQQVDAAHFPAHDVSVPSVK